MLVVENADWHPFEQAVSEIDHPLLEGPPDTIFEGVGDARHGSTEILLNEDDAFSKSTFHEQSLLLPAIYEE